MIPKRERGARERRRIARWTLGFVGLAALLLLVDYWAYPYGVAPGGRSLNRGENGLWLRYTWYFGQYSDANVAALSGRLRRHGIRFAYFHVRSISRDGSLKYRYGDRAKRLVHALRRAAPGVKLLAWIYAGNPRGAGEVDLANTAVRRRMAAEAAWLVRDCGFDGVQWDYEICSDGDNGFLALMRETRAAMPKGALLGAACPVLYPFPLGRYGWSERYFGQIAGTCDQIAVMCYDTGFVLPRTYVWLASEQVARVTSAVSRANPSCRVMIGVPTYGAGFRSHNPKAENIGFALRGIREGLADSAARPRVFAGVAVFADYTTDASEWADYDRLWPPSRQ